MSRRIEQLNALLGREIGAILARDVEFPKGTLVTIVHVETSGDLKVATVVVSIFPEQMRKTALTLLLHETPTIEEALNTRVFIYRIPSLQWKVDTTEEKAADVEEILDSLKEKG